MKKVVCVLFILFIIACQQQKEQTQQTQDITPPEQAVKSPPPSIAQPATLPKEGEIVLDIRAVLAQEPDPDIQSTTIMILSTSAYHKDKGFWTTVLSEDRSISTNELTRTAVLQPSTVKSIMAGPYSFIKIKLGDVMLKRKEHKTEATAILPAKELKIPIPFDIQAEQQTPITIDFIVEKSVHKQDDTVIFAPVVKVRTGKDTITLNMNENGQLGSEPFSLIAWQNRASLPQPQTEKPLPAPEGLQTIEQKKAALDAATIKIGVGEKKKFAIKE